MSNVRSTAKSHPPGPAPVQFAGQWVAWNKERTAIVANGYDMADVHRTARRLGFPDAVLQRVRNPATSFIGAR